LNSLKLKINQFYFSINIEIDTIVALEPGVKKRNGTERNGSNGIFSETENIWEDEKRKKT
jgi:hypothetical protein